MVPGKSHVDHRGVQDDILCSGILDIKQPGSYAQRQDRKQLFHRDLRR